MGINIHLLLDRLVSFHRRKFSIMIFYIAFGLFIVAPHVLSPYIIYVVSYIMILALVASALNITFGYGGMLHLHIAVFFGIGAYTTALMLIGDLSPWLSFVAGPIMALLLGFIIGGIVIRVKGIYFGLLTIAVGQLVWAVVYRWRNFTGGDDGIHGLKGYLPDLITTSDGRYYFILAIFLICVFIFYFITKSPFILTMVSYRDNPLRVESIGVNGKLQRLIAFSMSSFFAGIGGVLYVILEGSVYPSLLDFSFAIEIIIMCIFGGMGTFAGPYIGAAIVGLLTIYLGIYFEYWLFILGALLLLTILFMPFGIIGFVRKKANTLLYVER